ncbi:hypothetical protein [Winogradskyella immobilis]|uniref:Lipoprotein n=1 Tax=Winogradskyella immobilis TaxID=2816852 RepID=A0ABS8ENF3_9FLAO|nr:hypothetical protein [Winogradskyella immobilis]MCC1484532.1 hypothetical protein [Winogradskyella immobilis]MCG0016624.1 hypothetical protein [Winogradskyella immobilis]
MASVKKMVLLIAFCIINISCKNNNQEQKLARLKTSSVAIYNFADKENFNAFNRLELDKTHPNLLNPQVSKSNYNDIRTSWTKLHQDIGNYISKNDFDWNTNDSIINIVHKFYFKPNGSISHYFYNIRNSNISDETKSEYGKLLQQFSNTNKISITRGSTFAQCGKTKYLNE